MVKLLQKQSSISCTENTRSTGGLQAHNERETRSTIIQTKISGLTERKTIFLPKPKDDRTYGERVEDRFRLTGELSKLILKDANKMVEATVQLGGDITK